jgi:chromosome segregation ATPase
MVSTREPMFVLERIVTVGGDEIQVTGSWHGIDDSYLHQARLLIHGEAGSDRVDAVDGSLTGDAQRWSARFRVAPSHPIAALELEIGGELRVDLPLDVPSRRRFGRLRLPVQVTAAPAPAPGAREARAAPGEPPPGEDPPGSPAARPVAETGEDDIVAVHTALLLAQEELIEAQEELDGARAAAARAREDADRARLAREREAARAREAVTSLRAVADEAVRQERARAAAVAADRERLAQERDAAAAQAADLHRQLEALQEDRDQLAVRSRSEVESVQAALAAAEAEVTEQKDRQTVLSVALSAARDDSRRLAQLEEEHERACAERDAARAGWQEAQADVGRLRSELVAAHDTTQQAEAEAGRLRGELVAAHAAAEQADAEIRRLAAALQELDGQLEAGREQSAAAHRAAERARRDALELERQRDAIHTDLRRFSQELREAKKLERAIAGLEEQLEESRRAIAAAVAEREHLRRRLQGVRAALQDDG